MLNIAASRDELKSSFLNQHVKNITKIDKLPFDFSFRRYERIHSKEGKSFILMDAVNLEHENTVKFVTIARELRKKGFYVPEIYAHDELNGFVLLEDFGDISINKMLLNKSNQEISGFYKQIIDTLIGLQTSNLELTLPDFDQNIINIELNKFLDFYAVDYYDFTLATREEFLALWHEVLSNNLRLPKVPLYRDYHVDNMHFIEEKTSHRIGLIDFQDLSLGSPAYDLVSLLEDARRFVDPSLRQSMIKYYLSNTSYDSQQFKLEYALLGAQKNLKIVGLFTRRTKQDNGSKYKQLLEYVLHYLKEDFECSKLSPIYDWLAKYNLTKALGL